MVGPRISARGRGDGWSISGSGVPMGAQRDFLGCRSCHVILLDLCIDPNFVKMNC